MKKIRNIVYGGLLLASITYSCQKEDKLDSNSVFVDSKIEQNDLDKYIYSHFIQPYNVDILYKYVDRESDLDYHLVPAPYESSIRLVKLIEYLGFEPYNDITGSKEFLRSNFPKVLNFIGSVAVRNNGTVVLGTAENGAKMTLYDLLNLNATSGKDPIFLNDRFFKTIHHEFQHILNQRKPFPTDFAAITGTTYVNDSWNTIYSPGKEGLAVAAGYVSPYASNSPEEDFAELFSFYVSRSQADFDARLKVKDATDAGRAIISRKLNIVKTYMKDAWGINMDVLRQNILDRMAKLDNFDQTTI